MLFINCSSLTSITLPESLTSIGYDNFYFCSSLTEITSLNTTPPSCDSNPFYNVPTSTCVLRVPAESVEAYKAADPWKDFANIVPISSSTPTRVLVTDVLTADMFAATNTTYKSFEDVTATSAAVYTGNTALQKTGAIQLRSTGNSGIVSTVSGGTVKKVAVTWNATTSVTGNRALDVYGCNEAFTATSELYSNVTATKLGSITYVTDTELEIAGTYAYIGLRSQTGAVYIDKIEITWETTSVTPPTNEDEYNMVVFAGTNAQTTQTIQKTDLQTLALLPNALAFVDAQIDDDLPANIVTKNAYGEWTAKTINLTDGVAFYCPEDVAVETVNYTRTFSNTDWQAIFLPFELQEADWTGKAEMAYIGNVHQYDDNKDGAPDRTMLEFYTVLGGRLRANVPYIVKPNATGETAFTATNTTLKATPATDAYVDCSSTTHLYTISGTYQPKTDMYTSGAYALSNGGFCLASSDAAVLQPFRVYLTVSSRLGEEEHYVRPQQIGLMVDGEGVTGIEASVARQGCRTSVSYDLTGRRVQLPSKGIFIRDGKKVVIR